MKKQELIEKLKRLRDRYPVDDSHEGVRQGLLIAIGMIDQLLEPTESEKVVVPQFVATFIEDSRNKVGNLVAAIWELYEYEHKRVYDWALEDGNDEVLMKAFANGCEVEKEQLYYVLDKQGKTLLMLMGGEVCTSGGYVLSESTFTKDIYQLTEKQIKDYDQRFWSFAVEVAE